MVNDNASLSMKQNHKTIKHIIEHLETSDCLEEQLLFSFHDVGETRQDEGHDLWPCSILDVGLQTGER